MKMLVKIDSMNIYLENKRKCWKSDYEDLLYKIIFVLVVCGKFNYYNLFLKKMHSYHYLIILFHVII